MKKRRRTAKRKRRRAAAVARPRRKPRPRPRAESLAGLEKQVRRHRSARRRLERRLIAAVQEIGTLRQFEARAAILEREVEKRDAEIARLARENDQHRRELESRLGGASIVSTS